MTIKSAGKIKNTNRVIHLVEELKPWRFVPPIAYSKSVLELPKGTIIQEGIEEGDKLGYL